MKSKLVRNKIPKMIKENNGNATCYTVGDNEYRKLLIEKMQEELLEFKENPCEEEAADMHEVWLAICKEWELDPANCNLVADEKREARGGFDAKYALVLDDEDDENNDWNVSSHGELK